MAIGLDSQSEIKCESETARLEQKYMWINYLKYITIFSGIQNITAFIFGSVTREVHEKSIFSYFSFLYTVDQPLLSLFSRPHFSMYDISAFTHYCEIRVICI